MRKKIIGWLIGKLLPKYHLSRNPPKGIKRSRRSPTINESLATIKSTKSFIHFPDPEAIFKE